MSQRHTRTARRAALVAALLSMGGLAVTATPAVGPEEARQTALTFGRAMTAPDLTALRSVLPAEGKVQLGLDKLGPERGYFSARQVEALLAEFLAAGRVRAFELLRVECEDTIALVHARAALTDRSGRPARVKLHLALRPESGRWVLREIRELPS